jgi:galactose mutarotase-like enzyme
MIASEVIELSSLSLQIQVNPWMGGRIASLVDSLTGFEWLYPGVSCGPLIAGTAYADGSRGGFDECLPTVSPCNPSDVGWPQGTVGDHGDLWWRPWSVVKTSAQRLELSSEVEGYPLTLVRSIELSGTSSALRLDYELSNHGPQTLPYLYSAHPLFAMSDRMMIEMPAGSAVLSAFGDTLETGVWSEWPWCQGKSGKHRVDLISAKGAPDNFKVFVRSSGRVTLRCASSGRGVMFRFDPELVPWVGVCVNRRSWPEVGARDTWIAIEPTTAPTDDLLTAQVGGWAREIRPGSVHEWSLELTLLRCGEGPSGGGGSDE